MNQSMMGIQSDLSTAVLFPSHITECHYKLRNNYPFSKEKVLKIKQNCLDLVNRQSVTARDLAQLIGRLTTTNQAVLPSLFCYRSIVYFKQKHHCIVEGITIVMYN